MCRSRPPERELPRHLRDHLGTLSLRDWLDPCAVALRCGNSSDSNACACSIAGRHSCRMSTAKISLFRSNVIIFWRGAMLWIGESCGRATAPGGFLNNRISRGGHLADGTTSVAVRLSATLPQSRPGSLIRRYQAQTADFGAGPQEGVQLVSCHPDLMGYTALRRACRRAFSFPARGLHHQGGSSNTPNRAIAAFAQVSPRADQACATAHQASASAH